MASKLPAEIGDARPVMVRVGKQVLEVVTAGMYNDPCMTLREYIQNAADSIDVAVAGGLIKRSEGRIQVDIDGGARSINILDNGAGIPNKEAEQHLGSVGCSLKEGLSQRGFRGIGRLGGVAYCDLLRFETRVSGGEKVAVVEWDGRTLRQAVGRERRDESVDDAVRRVARVRFRKGGAGDPARFCRVQLVGVRRFHSDKLMDIRGVRDYLSHAAPAPFDTRAFSFADAVRRHVAVVPGYNVYRIEVNGQQVFKPHADEVVAGPRRADRLSSVELFEWRDAEDRLLARGWYAKTHYLASLPRQAAMRGIRLRQGNIEIGNEYSLESIYAERRFATWHIGEIHLVAAVKPNARRDGFEESPEYERFLEHANRLGRILSALCRDSSKRRGVTAAAGRKLEEIERLLRCSVLMDHEHFESYVREVAARMDDLERNAKVLNGTMRRRLANAREALAGLQVSSDHVGDWIDQRRLRNLSRSQILLMVCRAAFTEFPRATSASDFLHRVVAPYLKPNVAALLRL